MALSQRERIALAEAKKLDRTRPDLHVVFGYRKTELGTMEVCPEEAEVIREVCRMNAAGRTQRLMAAILNNANIPGPKWTQRQYHWKRRTTGIWTHKQIQEILMHRDLYEGSNPDYPQIVEHANGHVHRG